MLGALAVVMLCGGRLTPRANSCPRAPRRPLPGLHERRGLRAEQPGELKALLASVAAQDGRRAAAVVPGQGAKLPVLPDWIAALDPPENLAIPDGRSRPAGFGPGHHLPRRRTRHPNAGNRPGGRPPGTLPYDIGYRADMVLQHPRTEASRHAVYYRNTGRNRVWPAERHLPAVLVAVHLATWGRLHDHAAAVAPRAQDPAGLVLRRPPRLLPTTTPHAVAHRVGNDPAGKSTHHLTGA